jgi:hypothetical protein
MADRDLWPDRLLSRAKLPTVTNVGHSPDGCGPREPLDHNQSIYKEYNFGLVLSRLHESTYFELRCIIFSFSPIHISSGKRRHEMLLLGEHWKAAELRHDFPSYRRGYMCNHDLEIPQNSREPKILLRQAVEPANLLPRP